MSYRIQESLAWIAKKLGIDRASSEGLDLEAPALVPETIQPAIDVLGWTERLRGYDRVDTVGASSSLLPEPPEGEHWLVFAASVIRTNAGSSVVRFDLFDRSQAGAVAVQNPVTLAQFGILTIDRPFLLYPGQLLAAESNAAANFTVRQMYLRLTPGEYLPGSPYG